jgi:integrase
MDEQSNGAAATSKYPLGVYTRKGSQHLWIYYSWRGQVFRESAKTANPRKAARLRQSRLARFEAGVFAGPQQSRATVADVLDAYVKNRRLAGKIGLKKIIQRVGRLKAALGVMRAEDVTLDVLERLAEEYLAKGYARGTVKVDLAYLHSAFKITRRKGLIACNPDFPVIQVDNARTGFFERHQYEAVAAALAQRRPNYPHGQVLADVATFAYLSGWRIGEVFGLTWADVDRQRGQIVLPSTTSSKRRKDRLLPLVGELAELIERRWKARVVGSTLGPWVFHRNGRPIRNWVYAWRTACAAAKVVGKIPHDFRRTAVRNMDRAGVSRKVGKSITGHVTDSVYERYHIVTEDDQRAALEKRLQAESILAQSLHSQPGRPQHLVEVK